MEANNPDSNNGYIAGFPKDILELLSQVWATIRGAAPKATENPLPLDLITQIVKFRFRGKFEDEKEKIKVATPRSLPVSF